MTEAAGPRAALEKVAHFSMQTSLFFTRPFLILVRLDSLPLFGLSLFFNFSISFFISLFFLLRSLFSYLSLAFSFARPLFLTFFIPTCLSFFKTFLFFSLFFVARFSRESWSSFARSALMIKGIFPDLFSSWELTFNYDFTSIRLISACSASSSKFLLFERS